MYCQERYGLPSGLAEELPEQVLGGLTWFENERLGEKLHVAHPIEPEEAEVLTQFAPGPGKPGRRIKP